MNNPSPMPTQTTQKAWYNFWSPNPITGGKSIKKSKKRRGGWTHDKKSKSKSKSTARITMKQKTNK
jgi:hypothetical protein